MDLLNYFGDIPLWFLALALLKMGIVVIVVCIIVGLGIMILKGAINAGPTRRE